MLKDRERYVLATSKASVIRKALSLVLAGAKSEGDVSADVYQSLELLARNGCERLVLDLRAAIGFPAGTAPRFTNLRASHLGHVLVVTSEATAPQILQEVRALCGSHFSPQYLAAGLLAIAHTLF
jgi:hypothetical protein